MHCLLSSTATAKVVPLMEGIRVSTGVTGAGGAGCCAGSSRVAKIPKPEVVSHTQPIPPVVHCHLLVPEGPKATGRKKYGSTRTQPGFNNVSGWTIAGGDFSANVAALSSRVGELFRTRSRNLGETPSVAGLKHHAKGRVCSKNLYTRDNRLRAHHRCRDEEDDKSHQTLIILRVFVNSNLEK